MCVHACVCVCVHECMRVHKHYMCVHVLLVLKVHVYFHVHVALYFLCMIVECLQGLSERVKKRLKFLPTVVCIDGECSTR